MEQEIYIYFLEKNGNVFYVGRTIDLKTRECAHRIKHGKDINFCVAHIANQHDDTFWELHYIWLFKSFGFVLLNKNLGINYCKEKSVNRKKSDFSKRLKIYNKKKNNSAAAMYLKSNSYKG